jgi:hypothetical protein
MYENEIHDHCLSYKIQNNTTGLVVKEVEDTVMDKNTIINFMVIIL